jgi:tellurite resistance protein
LFVGTSYNQIEPLYSYTAIRALGIRVAFLVALGDGLTDADEDAVPLAAGFGVLALHPATSRAAGRKRQARMRIGDAV